MQPEREKWAGEGVGRWGGRATIMQHRPVRQRLLLLLVLGLLPVKCPCLPVCPCPCPKQADRNLYEALSVLRFHFNIQCNERLQAVLSQSGLSVE